MTPTIESTQLDSRLKDCDISPQGPTLESGVLDTPVRDIVFEWRAMEVGRCLVTRGAYGVMFSVEANNWLTWKNGIRAPVYCDCRILNRFSLERKLVSATLTESVKRAFPDAEAIVSMASAGIPWGRLVADDLDLPFAYVRSSAKGHGSNRLVEGEPPKSSKAVVIDDLIASGGSTLAAIHALKNEADIEVIGVQSIVNWGFRTMRRNLADYRVVTLTSYPYILLNAVLHRLINRDQFLQLLDFYHDPTHFIWPQLRSEDHYTDMGDPPE